MPRPGKTLIEPVAFTKREAVVLIDLARDRLAAMVVVDREDVDTRINIVEAVKKLEGANQGQRTADTMSETASRNLKTVDRSKRSERQAIEERQVTRTAQNPIEPPFVNRNEMERGTAAERQRLRSSQKS